MDLQRRLAEWLLNGKHIKRKVLDQALETAREQEQELEVVLVESGSVKRETLLKGLQELTEVPSIDLQQTKVKALVAQLIPREMVDRFRLLCVSKTGSMVTIAMADPSDSFALEFVKMRTGLDADPRCCYIGDLMAATEEAFSKKVAFIGRDTPMKSEGGVAAPSDDDEEQEKPKFQVASARMATPRANAVSQGAIKAEKKEITPIALSGFRSVALPSHQGEEAVLKSLLAVGRDLASTLDPEALILKILQNVQDITQSEGSSLILVGSEGNELYFKESIGPRAEEVKNVRMPLDEHSVVGYAVSNRVALKVNDVNRDPRHSKKVDEAVEFKTRNMVVAPVLFRGDPLGVLTAVNKREFGAFTDADLNYLEILASQAAVALNNASTVDRLRNFYNETVGILVDVLERFDAISRDHMVDVARFATTMGQHLQLSPPEIERLCYAGLLHDVGKIKFADPNDPRHAEEGAEMLSRVQLLHDVVPLIRHHHESYDGSGFPDGLARDEIPYLSKVLALAEAWVEGLNEASDPHALLSEIREDFGVRFDPDLKQAFESTVSQMSGR